MFLVSQLEIIQVHNIFNFAYQIRFKLIIHLDTINHPDDKCSALLFTTLSCASITKLYYSRQFHYFRIFFHLECKTVSDCNDTRSYKFNVLLLLFCCRLSNNRTSRLLHSRSSTESPRSLDSTRGRPVYSPLRPPRNVSAR